VKQQRSAQYQELQRGGRVLFLGSNHNNNLNANNNLNNNGRFLGITPALPRHFNTAMYLLKQLPEDFVVIEIPSAKTEKQGKYLYFWMKKKGRNTLDVVKELARRLRIREKDIGFAGSKDKQAVTEQMISIAGMKKEEIEKGMELGAAGYLIKAHYTPSQVVKEIRKILQESSTT
jgi:TruD family tRNA pseudouridine synthase